MVNRTLSLVYFRGELVGRGWTVVDGKARIGPHGEKRPGNPIANAVHVAKLATGEAEEQYVDTAKQAGGKKGGAAAPQRSPLSSGARSLSGQRKRDGANDSL